MNLTKEFQQLSMSSLNASQKEIQRLRERLQDNGVVLSPPIKRGCFSNTPPQEDIELWTFSEDSAKDQHSDQYSDQEYDQDSTSFPWSKEDQPSLLNTGFVLGSPPHTQCSASSDAGSVANASVDSVQKVRSSSCSLTPKSKLFGPTGTVVKSRVPQERVSSSTFETETFETGVTFGKASADTFEKDSSQNPHARSKDQHSRSKEQVSRSNEETSQNPHVRSKDQHSRSKNQLSRSKDQNPHVRSKEQHSRSKEQVSRSNEEHSRSKDQHSRSKDQLSRTDEEISQNPPSNDAYDWSEHVKDYLEDKQPTTQTKYKLHLKKLFEFLKEQGLHTKPPEDITAADLKRFKKHTLKRHSDGVARSRVHCLH